MSLKSKMLESLLHISFDNKKDIIVLQNDIETLMFRSLTKFCRYFKMRTPVGRKAIEKGKILNYNIYILIGTKEN